MDATQIILIVFIVLLIIIYPILVSSKNKKENQRMQEQTNSLKRGDKVLTGGGIYGTIVDLHRDGDKTIVTIETGVDKTKGYMSIDAYAIYTVFRDEQNAELEKIEDSKPEQEIKSQENESADEKPQVEEQADTTETQDEQVVETKTESEQEPAIQESDAIVATEENQVEEKKEEKEKSKKKSRKKKND